MRAHWGTLRAAVLTQLEKRPCTVLEIAKELGASYGGVSDVMRMLRDLDIVERAGSAPSEGFKPRSVFRLSHE